MIELCISIAAAIGSGIFMVLFWCVACENDKLKELVKQKEAEIKQLKRAMRDRDWEEKVWLGVIPLYFLAKEKERKNDDNIIHGRGLARSQRKTQNS